MKNIVIVGGGSAGWLAAGLLAREHRADTPEGLTVTLIESPDVSTIGVGEGTWPSMRNTLSRIGIREADFIRSCGASFKQGSKFVGWAEDGNDEFYYHPFVEPRGYTQANLVRAWRQNFESLSFADAVAMQPRLCELGLAPKQYETPDYAAVQNYGYHLDAGKFAALLQQHCTTKLGVRHVLDHVTEVVSAENGDVAAVRTKEAGAIHGDLFIDCSGLKSLILGQHFGVPFVSKKQYLFNDAAIAIQVPYLDESSAIASATLATAQESGWVWDIGLHHRRGVGHVYSSAHTSDDEAERVLRAYVARTVGEKVATSCSSRKLAIDPGHRAYFWHKNCVAVGMSAGFIEPLEASALALVEMSINMISEELPLNRQAMDIVAKRFNSRFEYRWQRIVDFLKLHYVLSRRRSSDYWRDATSEETTPETLRELMDLWKNRPPHYNDFPQKEEAFPSASYQYVLYGMGFQPEFNRYEKISDRLSVATSAIEENNRELQRFRALLPGNRELLDRIMASG